jgi:hypothetical protein
MESIPMDDYVIYPSKLKLLLVALGSLSFVVLGIFLPTMTTDMYVVLIGTYVGVPFFGLCFLYAIYRLIFRKPSLIIANVGLFDNASALGAGLIRWTEISEVYIYEYMGQRMIGIIVNDPKAVMARQPAFKRFMARMNSDLVGTPFNIPQTTVPVSVDEILARIEERRTAHRTSNAE